MKTIRSIGYAWFGIRHAFATQRNLKIHTALAVFAIMLGIALRISSLEWLLVSISIGAVIFAELINTALEKLADVVEPNQHPEIKLVKDIAAGAVLILAIICAVIGAIIFVPKIINLIQSI